MCNFPYGYYSFRYIDYDEFEALLVIKDGKLGFVDNNNNIVIPCMYDNEAYDFEYSYKFSNGFAAVNKQGK